MEPGRDITTTRFVLPPDAKLLPVEDLAPRLRAKLGPVDENQVVVTRPGFRITTRLVTSALADLLGEFRDESLITDAILRFSKAYRQDPSEILDFAFDAIATFIDGRTLVAADSADVQAAEPSLAAGQAVAGMEVVHLVRSLDDTEVYRVRMGSGEPAALKIARDKRAEGTLSREAEILEEIGGGDIPALLLDGRLDNRKWIAIEWRDGISIAAAAQQARSSGDRPKLHQIARKLLEAYCRLHVRGYAHGDIHTGNILVNDEGKIIILDFGRARKITDSDVRDPNRAGIAHYYDPQIAVALLAGELPPAASQASEQFALATLAYLLLTGLHPIDIVAEQQELLHRIITRPMLPFSARGVDACPPVEAVLRIALAKNEDERFPGTAAFAQAFSDAGVVHREKEANSQAIEHIVMALKKGDSSLLMNAKPHHLAWLSLRSAILLSDAELLSIADIWSARSGRSIEECCVAIEVARARSDRSAERELISNLLVAVNDLSTYSEKCDAMIHTALMLAGTEAHISDYTELIKWSKQSRDDLKEPINNDEVWIYTTLLLHQSGTITLPSDLPQKLDVLDGGSFWLWASAFRIFQRSKYFDRALSAIESSELSLLGFAYLRLHQLTGEIHWVSKAKKLTTTSRKAVQDFGTALLTIENDMAAGSIKPPFRLQ